MKSYLRLSYVIIISIILARDLQNPFETGKRYYDYSLFIFAILRTENIKET